MKTRFCAVVSSYAFRRFFIIRISPLVIFLFFLLLTACTKPTPPAPPDLTTPRQLLIPKTGAYTGAYMDFGVSEDAVTLEGIEEFEKLVGKHQAIIASSSYWGEQSFPIANLNVIWRHGSIPLVFWSPWDRPYIEYKEDEPDRDFVKKNKFSLTNILAGQWDTYIDTWADAARAFGQPLMVSFCNEMNGNWFPWSGYFYGANNVLPGTEGSEKYEGPEVFKKAYRYVVNRVRARGATNILWVFHAMNYAYPQDVWNLVDQYYPGPDYVDWLGLSVYGQQFQDENWSPFKPLLDWPYQELCALDPAKPIMLAEWGVGEFAKSGNKPQFIKDAFAVTKNYPRVKAAVFWHERWQNSDKSYSNLRANSSPESLAAFQAGVADPFWLGEPILKPHEK